MAHHRGLICVLPDAAAVAAEAAERLQRALDAAVAARGQAAIALSGGSTPRRLLALLGDRARPYREAIAWSSVHLFWGDERHVPATRAESNFHMAREALLEGGPVPAANVHRVRTEAIDAATAAQSYEAQLRAFFAARRQAARFDVVLLGLGADGHTASLFPGTAVLDEQERLVAAPWVPSLGAHRITLTLPAINAARQVIFLVTGAEKAATLHDVIEGPRRIEALPAQGVQPQGDLLWLVDEAAASRLSEPVARRGPDAR